MGSSFESPTAGPCINYHYTEQPNRRERRRLKALARERNPGRDD